MKIPKRAPPMTDEYRKMIEDLHKERESFHEKHPCPKCGNEMQELRFFIDKKGDEVPLKNPMFRCFKCGHEKKVKTDEK